MKFLFIVVFVLTAVINALFMAATLHARDLKLAALFALGVTVCAYIIFKHVPGV